ncbi:carbamate kinase [Parvimonas sp. G1641]|jgi:carbamate kinase|uniref:carbamate kinase n=1 Tax=Parvimonas TaxID=543311 RepID=UPI001CAC5623|nr:carbamate kinase [Parvimonas micra]MBF1036539.1 carbamate kinase [Parvimonas sp.]MCE3020577.1 carbamate kinase [Parvimonas micra]
MGKRIVVALGGNALGNTPFEQLEKVKIAADIISDLVKEGNDVIIGHGNGPQVGMINLAMDYSANGKEKTPLMPLVECGAMSQGYIGYHLQQALGQAFKEKGINKTAVSVITQVEVAEDDKAFENPTKPVGMFYTKEKAEELERENGFTFVEDSGRGYRKVVPSPKPLHIVEIDAINKMVEAGLTVITVGGGGIPVVNKNGRLVGVDAVIDKDKSSAELASELNADFLLILTAVDKVCINFNKPDQKELDEITVEEANKYIAEGQFAKGSMLPKVEACLDFVKGGDDRCAIITLLEKASDAVKGLTGTKIVK